jgi:hypothetical protein
MSQISFHLSLSAIKNQLSKIWKTIAVSLLISLGGAGFTVLVAKLTDNPIWKLVKDPSDVRSFPPYIGLLSNWGIILWTAAAAICLFSAVILKQQKASNDTFKFIAVSGGFSLVLGIDDLYLLHDGLLPKIFNISETFFYILYIFAFAAYLIYFIPQILKYEYLLFFMALFFFLISRKLFVTLPFFNQFISTGDMLKYFGIVFWLAFFYRTSLYEVSLQKKRFQSKLLDS